ncbi:AP2 domain-containing protein [Burkholderia pseudomallei]|uniref:AP2 domain-containing protein n=1 Tax=Burkholderia pseudomallei TaxID=28450 RepID=UPI0012F5023B|nr:AP2 domain-containing protein [Burkholderia pseudomallei]
MGQPKHLDLAGQKFGRLTAIAFDSEKTTRKAYWVCKCDCGTVKSVRSDLLKRGTTVSCGCFSVENAKRVHTKHGMYKSPEYQAWVNMRARCYDSKSRHYKNYGGRGIGVCTEWRESFDAFFAEVGLRPSDDHELDREENDKDYMPGNVRWVIRPENQKNRRCSKNWIIEGRLFETMRDAATEFGVHPSTIQKWCDGLQVGNRFYPPKANCRSELRNGQ